MSLQEILTAAPDCSQTPNEVRSLVLDYLLHSCYCESAAAFLQDVSVAEENRPALDTLWEDGPATESRVASKNDALNWDDRVLDDARLRQSELMRTVTLAVSHKYGMISDTRLHSPRRHSQGYCKVRSSLSVRLVDTAAAKGKGRRQLYDFFDLFYQFLTQTHLPTLQHFKPLASRIGTKL